MTSPLVTPDKLANHERLLSRPQSCFIASRSAEVPLWHIGTRRELRYDKSGLIASVYYVTKCSGKQLGGAYGQHECDKLPPAVAKCPRCFRNPSEINVDTHETLS